MVRWHHQLDGNEFEQAPRVGDGQGSLAYCSPWSHRESDTTEWLNWTEKWTAKKKKEVELKLKLEKSEGHKSTIFGIDFTKK